jgi:hypothetical protein
MMKSIEMPSGEEIDTDIDKKYPIVD